jgi:hypothetical protein
MFTYVSEEGTASAFGVGDLLNTSKNFKLTALLGYYLLLPVAYLVQLFT